MAEQSGFKRNVGLFMAVMIGIGAMMGPGIFALPSEVAESAGPLGIIAYLAMGLLTLFTAFSYSELGAAIPIAGGGNQGSNIADRLLKQDEFRMVFRSSEYQITFIEQDEEKCEKLEQRFNVPIFHGDGTKQEVLEQVEPQKMDVAIAATNDDQRNSIIALQAKRLGINQVIAIARDPAYVSLLEDSGIVCISAPYATAAMVENYLDRPSVADLFEIESGVASLIDMVVPEDAEFVVPPADRLK